MPTWGFALHLNRSLLELGGLVIEKTEVAYLKSFPYIVVKKTFQGNWDTWMVLDPWNQV